jgi:hypothetical protein
MPVNPLYKVTLKRKMLFSSLIGTFFNSWHALLWALPRNATQFMEAQSKAPPPARTISFAFIGDVPYNTLEEGALQRIYQSFPKDLAFVLHIGDLKSGTEECSDTLLTRRFDLLQKCPLPLVLLPGDNEWVDCSRSVAGGYDPVERLKFWRQLEARDRRADQALKISRQPLWPELVLWRIPEVSMSFVGLNIPGSFDATGNSAAAREHRRLRNTANFDWLELAGLKAEAEKDKFLFVAIHANVRLDTGRPEDVSSSNNSSSNNGSFSLNGALGFSSSPKPYQAFKQALAKLMGQYSGQVIVLYGDTHQFRVDYPWEDIYGKRLMAVQCYGSPFNGSWLKIDVDPRQAQPKVTAQPIV